MLWLLLTLVVIAAAWLPVRVRFSRPAPRQLTDARAVEAAFQTLLSRGVNGSTVRFCERGGNRRCLTFSKHVEGMGKFGLTMRYPLTPDDQAVDHRFREEVASRGIWVQQTTTSENIRELVLECGQDLGLAQVALRTYFGDVLGLSVTRDCEAFFSDVMAYNIPKATGVAKSSTPGETQ